MATPTKYEVQRDRKIGDELFAEAGDFVYAFWGCDYGLANDDSRMTGIEHTSVTKNADGSFPAFTIPVRDLIKV